MQHYTDAPKMTTQHSNAEQQTQQYPESVPPSVFYSEPPPPYSINPPSQGPPPAPGFIHTPGPGVPITVQPISIGLSPNPIQITCPKCNASTLTEISVIPGLLTYLMSGLLILCGCWFGCCLVPCCIPECMDIEHRCSNCKIHIGTYRRL